MANDMASIKSNDNIVRSHLDVVQLIKSKIETATDRLYYFLEPVTTQNAVGRDEDTGKPTQAQFKEDLDKLLILLEKTESAIDHLIARIPKI